MDELLKRANKLKRQMYRRAGKDINSESTINDINNWLNKENLDFTYFLKCVAYQQFSDFDNIADFTLAAYSKAKELQRFQDETLEAAEQLVLIEELIDKADKLYKLTDGGLFDIHCLAAPLGSFDAKVVRQKDSSCAVMLFDTNLLALSNHVAKYIYTLLELDELDCSNASKSKDVYKLVGKNLSKAEGDVICDIANVCQTGKLPENIPPIFLKTGILGGIEKKATFLPDLPHFDCDPEHSTEMFAEFLKSAFDRSSAEKHEGQPCEGKKYRNNTLEDKLCESARGFIVFHELSHVYEEKSLNYDQGAYSESDIEYFKKIHMESNGLYKWPEPEVIYRRSKQHEREYNADFNSLLLLLSLEKGKKHYQNLGQVDLTVMAGVFISLYTIEIIERFVDISMNGSENILREFNTDDHFSKSFFLRDSHPAPIARIDMLYSNLHQMPDDFFEGIEKHIFLNSVQDLILSIVGTFETLWKILYRPFADGNGIRTSRPAPEILARSIHLSFYEDLSNYKRFISNPAKDLFVFMQYGNFPSLTYNEMKEDLKSTKINERLFLKCFLAQRNNPYIKGNHPDDYIESIISLYFKAGNICIGSSISLHNLKKKFESILSRNKTQIDSINIENTINRKIISIEATEKDNIFFLFDQYLIDRIVDICNLSVPTIINKEHLASDPELLFEFNRETIITTGEGVQNSVSAKSQVNMSV